MEINVLVKKTYIILLAILAMLTANMYSPGMALIQQDLHAKQHLIQMTVSYYMLGLAIGMFFYGPISDRIGRRSILLITLCLYVLGVLLSALSHNITLFMISRGLQALGAAGPLALWQALAVDLDKSQSNKMIINGYIAISCVPAFSPFIGSWIIVMLNWQSLFLLLAIYGLLLLILTFCLHPKSSTAIPANQHSWLSSFKQYLAVISSPSFVLLTTLSAFMYSLFYVFITESPTLYHDTGYPGKDIGLFYIPIAVAFLIGSSLARVVANQNKSGQNVILLGMTGYVIGIVLQLFFQWQSIDSSWVWITLPFTLMTLSTGLLVPLVIAKAMNIHTQLSGDSAALIGVTQNIIAFGLSFLGAYLSYLGFTGLTLSLLLITLCIFILGYCASRIKPVAP